MEVNRNIGSAPKTAQVGREIATMPLCVGCTECKGLCQALIEAVTLPDVILNRDRT